MKLHSQQLLPVGTVVKIYDSYYRYIIIGYTKMNRDVANKDCNYVAVNYPEGLVSSNNLLLLNDDSIEQIDFLGFNNNVRQAFIDWLSSQ